MWNLFRLRFHVPSTIILWNQNVLFLANKFWDCKQSAVRKIYELNLATAGGMDDRFWICNENSNRALLARPKKIRYFTVKFKKYQNHWSMARQHTVWLIKKTNDLTLRRIRVERHYLEPKLFEIPPMLPLALSSTFLLYDLGYTEPSEVRSFDVSICIKNDFLC